MLLLNCSANKLVRIKCCSVLNSTHKMANTTHEHCLFDISVNGLLVLGIYCAFTPWSNDLMYNVGINGEPKSKFTETRHGTQEIEDKTSC